MKRLLCLAFLVGVGGCQFRTLPDPNDPKTTGVMQPVVLRNNLKGAADQFFGRVKTREITDARARKLLSDYANKLLEEVPIEKIPADEAWEYAEIFITAERWKDARDCLVLAVKKPATEDRRVNDNLRLARVLAKLGEVKEAISTARSVFDAKPTDKAPILTSVLLELVPAAEGKGSDAELAKLLLEAVPQSEQTIVDTSTDAGKLYLSARPFHIRGAFTKAVELYTSARQTAKAVEAANAADEWEKRNRART